MEKLEEVLGLLVVGQQLVDELLVAGQSLRVHEMRGKLSHNANDSGIKSRLRGKQRAPSELSCVFR